MSCDDGLRCIVLTNYMFLGYCKIINYINKHILKVMPSVLSNQTEMGSMQVKTLLELVLRRTKTETTMREQYEALGDARICREEFVKRMTKRLGYEIKMLHELMIKMANKVTNNQKRQASATPSVAGYSAAVVQADSLARADCKSDAEGKTERVSNAAHRNTSSHGSITIARRNTKISHNKTESMPNLKMTRSDEYGLASSNPISPYATMENMRKTASMTAINFSKVYAVPVTNNWDGKLAKSEMLIMEKFSIKEESLPDAKTIKEVAEYLEKKGMKISMSTFSSFCIDGLLSDELEFIAAASKLSESMSGNEAAALIKHTCMKHIEPTSSQAIVLSPEVKKRILDMVSRSRTVEPTVFNEAVKSVTRRMALQYVRYALTPGQGGHGIIPTINTHRNKVLVQSSRERSGE